MNERDADTAAEEPDQTDEPTADDQAAEPAEAEATPDEGEERAESEPAAESDADGESGADTADEATSATEAGAGADTHAGADAESGADAKSGTDSKTESDTESGPEADADTEAGAESGADAEADTEADTDSEAESDSRTGAETESGADAESDGRAESGAEDESGAEVESDADAEAQSDADTKTKTESDAEAEADAQGDTNTEPESEGESAVAAAVGERGGRGPRRGAHARRVTPRERLRELIAPQANRTQALIALACLVVGFGLSVQVRSTAQESSFASLRQSELVGLLDRLNKRQEDLRKEVTRLEQEKAALESEDSEAARRAAQDRQHTLAILAGTEPATGPGIELVISDPKGGVNAGDVLNAVQELRDAGAEVIQIGPQRVTVDTYFLDADGGIVVDDELLQAPYRIKAIGDPHTMRTAMDIPGGVLESLHRAGADGTVSSSQSVAVTAVKES